MRTSSSLLLMVSAVASGCLTSREDYQAMLWGMLDGDEDGYIDGQYPEEGGDDCDDEDALVYPGAEEICTGKDNDCDGYIDEGLSDFEGWWPDVDGDGYGDASAPLTRCPIPEDAVDNGLDCDDGNGAYNPEASDLADDGRDQNCDGVPGVDADGDGAASLVSGGEDCDDADAEVSPLAEEVAYNGVDDDCDSSTPDDDVDGDGFVRAEDCDDDNVFVYPGAEESCQDGVINDCWTSPAEAWEACGWPSEVAFDDARDEILGAEEDQQVGDWVVPLGDVLNQGNPTLAIVNVGTVNRAPTVFLTTPRRGPDSVEEGVAIDLPDIAYSWYPLLSDPGDVNADGHSDLILQRRFGEGGSLVDSEFVLLLGPVDDRTTLGDAALTISSSAPTAIPLGGLDTTADADQDGVNDWLFGATFYDNGAIVGGAWLMSGRSAGDVDLATEGVFIEGTENTAMTGQVCRFMADANGDGVVDIAIASPRSNHGGTDSGAVHIIYGPVSANISVDDADALVAGESAVDGFGSGIAVADSNGDGLSDLMIGAPGAGSASNAGAAYLMLAPFERSGSADGATLRVEGATRNDSIGTSLIFLSDVSGDDRPEAVIAAQYADSAGSTALVLSGTTGSMSFDDADVLFHGSEQSDRFGASVADVGDVNRDGLNDLAIGAPGYTDDLNNQGAVFIFHGAGP